MDENQTAQPSEVPSSGAEGQVAPQQSSAETQNTVPAEWQPDKNAKFVPYERFQEVVQGRNELKEKYAAFETKQDLLKTYEGFDKVLNENPQLFNAIMQLLQGDQQQQQPQQEMETTQKLAMDNYTNRFQNFCTENKIAEEMKPYVYQIAESFFLKVNPDPLKNYNMQTLNVALQHTKQFLESINKQNLAGYVQTKPNANNVPASASQGGGAPVPAPKPLGSQQDRAAAMAEMMRAGQV